MRSAIDLENKGLLGEPKEVGGGPVHDDAGLELDGNEPEEDRHGLGDLLHGLGLGAGVLLNAHL